MNSKQDELWIKPNSGPGTQPPAPCFVFDVVFDIAHGCRYRSRIPRRRAGSACILRLLSHRHIRSMARTRFVGFIRRHTHLRAHPNHPRFVCVTVEGEYMKSIVVSFNYKRCAA